MGNGKPDRGPAPRRVPLLPPKRQPAQTRILYDCCLTLARKMLQLSRSRPPEHGPDQRIPASWPGRGHLPTKRTLACGARVGSHGLPFRQLRAYWSAKLANWRLRPSRTSLSLPIAHHGYDFSAIEALGGPTVAGCPVRLGRPAWRRPPSFGSDLLSARCDLCGPRPRSVIRPLAARP
jgi:hypothetical protein